MQAPPMTGNPGITAIWSFDDSYTGNGAMEDSTGFVASLPERVILDQVQRVTALTEAIEISVDHNQVPGGLPPSGSTTSSLFRNCYTC